MPIVETLRRPVGINGSAKTHRRELKRHREDHKASERPSTAETTAAANAMQRDRDRAFETQARAELRKSSYYSVRQVSCDVCQRVVMLSGRVPSFYMKQMAQTIVLCLLEGEGRLVIDNQLEVDQT